MRLRKAHLSLLLLLPLFVSCQWKMNEVKTQSDVSVSVIRFDKLLHEYVELNSFSALQKMNTEYLAETKLLIEDVLELGQVNDNKINEKLKEYFTDSTLHALMRDALLKYENMEEYEKALTRGFRQLKHEIPSARIPEVYSQISALNGSIIVSDTIIGFSIDKYMGEDYPLYKKYYYDYQRRSMSPERIVPDCFTYYLMSEYPFPIEQSRRTLLHVMMHRGKIHYATTKILGYKTPEEQMGYTPAEAQWCLAYEKQIWAYMVENGHLSATDPMTIRKYTRPAPYTSYFGENSPMAVASWVGTRIIDAYMRHNKHVTLQELMENPDFGQILIDSKYKP